MTVILFKYIFCGTNSNNISEIFFSRLWYKIFKAIEESNILHLYNIVLVVIVNLLLYFVYFQIGGTLYITYLSAAKQFFRPSSVIACMQISRLVSQRTFTLARTRFLLRMDKYEPHNFRKFCNKLCIGMVLNHSFISLIILLYNTLHYLEIYRCHISSFLRYWYAFHTHMSLFLGIHTCLKKDGVVTLLFKHTSKAFAEYLDQKCTKTSVIFCSSFALSCSIFYFIFYFSG